MAWRGMPSAKHPALGKWGGLNNIDYFRVELTIFKVIGALILILSRVPPRRKEGLIYRFGIAMLSAFIGQKEKKRISVFNFYALNIFGNFSSVLSLLSQTK